MPASQTSDILARRSKANGIWPLTILSLIACLVYVGFSTFVILLEANSSIDIENPYQLHPATLCAAILVLINIPLSYSSKTPLIRNLSVWTVWIGLALVVWVRSDGSQIFQYQWVKSLIGDQTQAQHFSFASAVLLWTLATVQVINVGHSFASVRRWLSFFAICTVLLVSFGQIIFEFGQHQKEHFYGLSLPSALIIGLLSIVIAQFSHAKTIFFDPETPISNRISGFAIAFGLLGIVAGRTQGWDIWILWVGFFLFTMIIVLLIDQGVRTLERMAVQANAKDNRIHFAVFDQVSVKDAFETFHLYRTRAYYIHFLVVFASTICAIYLARLYTDPIASLWWANGLIAVALASFMPLNSYVLVLNSIFAMCLGNLIVGNTFGTSLFFSVLNTFEAVMVSFLYRRFILPRPTNPTQPRPFEAVFLSIQFLGGLTLITAVTAAIASQYIYVRFGQTFSQSYFEWLFGAILGHLAIVLLTYELLHSGGTIRQPKHKEFFSEWPLRIGISFLAVALIFGANIELNYVTEISEILLVLVFLAPLLHTNMTDIGFTFALMVLLLYFSGFHPFLHPEDLNSVVMFAFSGGFLFSLTILKESLIGRFQDQENVMQSAPSLLVTLDKNACVTSISNRMADLLDRPIEHVLGQTLPKLGIRTLPDSDFLLEKTLFDDTSFDEHKFEAILHVGNSEPAYLLGHIVKNYDEDMSFNAVVQFTQIQEIAKSRQQASLMLNNSGSFLVTHTDDGTILNVSTEWLVASGYEASEVIGSNMRDFFQFNDPTDNSFDLSSEKARMGEGVLTGQCKSGKTMILQRKRLILVDAEKETYLTALQDITDLKREVMLNEILLNRNAAVILSQDVDFKICTCSDAWTTQFGYSREETIGADLLDFMAKESAEDALAMRNSQDIEQEIFSRYISSKRTLVTKSGEERFVELKITTDVNDGIFTRTIVITDITDAVEERLAWDDMAHKDKATNLLNSRGLLRSYDQNQGHMFVFVRLNLPHTFRRGFETNLEVDILESCADLLQGLAPKGGMVGRIADQDFVIISPWTTWRQTQEFAEKVGNGLGAMRFMFHGVKQDCTFGIGLVRSTSETPFAEALHFAEVAASDALKEKKNSIVKVDDAFLVLHDEQGTFISDQDVANAFLAGEITYSLRPVLDTIKNKIIGFDARLIWMHANGKQIDPELFLPRFWRVRNRPDVFAAWDYLISKVFDYLAEYPGCFVAANLPAQDLNYDGAAQALIERFQALIGGKDLRAVANIGSDFGENFVDQDKIRRQLTILKNANFSLAFNEINLRDLRIESLLNYPIDTLRIGSELIKAAESDKKSYDMLRALVHAFQAQGLNIIATGVETPSQSALLRHVGVHIQQGLFYSQFDPKLPVLSELQAMSNFHYKLVQGEPPNSTKH